MSNYWEWKVDVGKQSHAIEKALTALAREAALYEKVAVRIADSGRTSVNSNRTGTLWLGLRETASKMRAGERRLTWFGYDIEVALSRRYFIALVRQAGIQKALTQKLQQTPDAVYDLHWYFEDKVPCANNVNLGVDRIGVVIHLTEPSREYDIATECAFHYSSTGVQFFPTRSAEVCVSGQENWPEQLEVQARVNKFLWTEQNWPPSPVDLPKTPFGDFVPYMETVGQNVSIFSKTRPGRHALLAPVGSVPADFDLAVSASAQQVTATVVAAIDKLNQSNEFNEPYHPTRVELQSGPTLNNPYIDFVLSLFHRDEGGTGAGEWHLDLSGQVLIEASFIRTDETSGSFQLAQKGAVSHKSGSLSTKIATIGIDEDDLPDFARQLVDDFTNIEIDGFEGIPVSVPNAKYIDCQVKSDRIVFFVRMS